MLTGGGGSLLRTPGPVPSGIAYGTFSILLRTWAQSGDTSKDDTFSLFLKLKGITSTSVQNVLFELSL